MLPSKLILASRPRWTGMGAVSLTSDLTSAASALTQFLTTTGCVTTRFDACSAFQTTYNAAGGGNQTLVVDGLYGPATQSALQEVNDQQGGGSAPAACVAAHNAGGGGGTSTASLVPGGGSSATVNVFGTQVSTKTLIIAAGAAAMLAIVGAAIFKTHADGATVRTRWRTRKAPRRGRKVRRHRAHARRRRHGRRRR
jgi:hypothetical protein